MKFPLIISIITVAVLFQANTIFSHSGGLDGNGGHTDHKTGEYHTHGDGDGSSSIGSYEVIDNRPQKTGDNSWRVKVENITDGDTFKTSLDGKETHIRLYGIDAPEDGQAYGDKSKEYFQQLVAGKEIEIKIVEYDDYGRAVALVFADGVNVNEEMVKEGAAWVYPKYCRLIFCEEWKENQGYAKAFKKLLWIDENPVAPYEWRHRK